jgi:hypothetical protein
MRYEPGCVRKWLGQLWVPLAYILLTLVMTHPALLHLGDQVLSDEADTWVFWWNNWWVKRALTTGKEVYLTKYMFFPHGADLRYHSFSWLNTALWLVLEPLMGTVAAYNLSVLWVFPLAGWGMERLAHELTGSKGAAFVAGLVYAFVPYHLGQYSHPNLMGVQWFPFYTLYLLRAMRSGRWQHVLSASLFLVLTALVGWHLFLYLVIWTMWIGCYAWLSRMAEVRRLFGVLVRIFLIGSLVLSPLLVPMLVGRFGTEETLGDFQQDGTQTDLLAYVLPNRLHPLWGQAVKPFYDQIGKPWRVAFVGYTVMILLGYALARKRVRRQTGLWWGGILLWWLMALGPCLRFYGHLYRNVLLPYYPLSRLYAFQLLRLPDRYNLILSLPIAVVIGYTIVDFLGQLRNKWRVGVLTLLSALILFEYLSVPVEMRPLQIPPFYQQLAQEKGTFGIVELPIDFLGSAKRYMLYQTVHGHPIVEGHVSRRPLDATAFLDAQPLLRSLYQTHDIDPVLTDVSRQLRALQDAGFRYIIMHKQFIHAGHVHRWRSWLATEPLFEDDEIVVYRTRPRYGQDYEFVGEVGNGIGVISATLSATALAQGGWLEAELAWGTRSAPGGDWLARLALVAPSGSEAQWVDFAPCQGWPTSEWGQDGVARGDGILRVDPFIAGGVYTVTVGLVDPVTGDGVGQRLSVGQVEVQAIERAFERPEVGVSTEVFFGDALQLLGYDLQREEQELHLTLHWQARRRMETAYKFFVHLLDVETGEMVAQADVMPRGWGYPTTWWEKGEVVSDEITLGVSEVPPGAYRVTIGVYDPGTGVRLPVMEAGCVGEARDHLLLPERWVLP